ncbi:hypothetical protein AAFF_G00229700 [Aldrovandia affinis]|uniref:Uncharacterized protein n=1 Tax=Aldrovandia affinis TaxID=143900 RepID=A0AAD7SVH2_9TELE|nr:hypothetical protein AAFF_G00229700 [Aldrovandia affinis]
MNNATTLMPVQTFQAKPTVRSRRKPCIRRQIRSVFQAAGLRPLKGSDHSRRRSQSRQRSGGRCYCACGWALAETTNTTEAFAGEVDK